MRAVEVYEVALTHPHVANATLFEDVIGKENAAITNSLDASDVRKARKRVLERDPWVVAKQLLADLESEMTVV